MSVQVPYPEIKNPVNNFKWYYKICVDHPDFHRLLSEFNCKHTKGQLENTYDFNTEEDLTFFILRWS